MQYLNHLQIYYQLLDDFSILTINLNFHFLKLIDFTISQNFLGLIQYFNFSLNFLLFAFYFQFYVNIQSNSFNDLNLYITIIIKFNFFLEVRLKLFFLNF